MTSRLIRAGIVLAAVVVAVVAAKGVSRVYWDPGVAALAGHWTPPDLGVFLQAGHDVVYGRNPYHDASTVGTEFGYVYPPLLAWAVSPLTALPAGGAATAWTLLMLVSLLGGLRLLGVSDVRCYLAALICPFTRSAFEYGTLGPLLVLLVAAAWRFRDRPPVSGLTVAGAIASKLFLWPLVVWFLATRRFRAGALTTVATIGLVLVPWAAIGLAGLGQYPELLHKADVRQSYRSYSLDALAQSLGASHALATLLTSAVGLVLLLLSYRAARLGGVAQAERDRRSLTLVIAASLAATPIVWSHYFVLVYVPVALASPTFSAAWLALAAAAVLDVFPWYRASPDGALLPVAVVAALVTAVFAWCARSESEPHERSGYGTSGTSGRAGSAALSG